jgi:hypothetical protein
VRDAGTDNQHPEIAFTPKAGIAKPGDHKTRGWCGDYRFRKLLPLAEVLVLRDGEALRFTPGMNTVTQRSFIGYCRRSDCGIDHGGFAVVEDCAAAENAIAIGTARRGRKSDRFVFPANHILACSVCPVHVAPNGGPGIVLVKHVIASAIADWPIGIIHPVVRGH